MPNIRQISLLRLNRTVRRCDRLANTINLSDFSSILLCHPDEGRNGIEGSHGLFKSG